MASTQSAEFMNIGLDNNWSTLSKAEAESLLRLFSSPHAEERTYTSVSIIPPNDGRSLYVQQH